MPEDLTKTVNEMGTVNNSIQLDHFDCDQHTAQQDHFRNTQDDNYEHYVSMDNFDYESEDDLDNSQQIDGMNSDARFLYMNEIQQLVESSISTNVSMNMPTGVTVIHTRRQYGDISMTIYTSVSTGYNSTSFLQRHSTVVSLRSSLFASLRSEFLQPFLLTSLKNEILRPSLLTSLKSIFLRHLYRGSLRSCLYKQNLKHFNSSFYFINLYLYLYCNSINTIDTS